MVELDRLQLHGSRQHQLPGPDARSSKIDYASGNLLYYPAENLMLGGELMYGQRKNNDDASEDDVRFQFTVKYNFGIKL